MKVSDVRFSASASGPCVSISWRRDVTKSRMRESSDGCPSLWAYNVSASWSREALMRIWVIAQASWWAGGFVLRSPFMLRQDLHVTVTSWGVRGTRQKVDSRKRRNTIGARRCRRSLTGDITSCHVEAKDPTGRRVTKNVWFPTSFRVADVHFSPWRPPSVGAHVSDRICDKTLLPK